MKNVSKGTKILSYIGLILWMLINLFPVYWMFTFSLKDNKEIFGDNVVGLPRHWLWSNYTSAWGPIGAALVLATFPTLFIYIFLSKRIQESFVAGAVKG